MRWVTLCPLAALAEARPLGADADGLAACLVRLGDKVHAVHESDSAGGWTGVPV